MVVPFPLVDLPIAKRRPALALTSARFAADHGQAILAMITSARHSAWPSDVALGDWRSAGLTAPSVLRWKVFTLPVALVAARIGRLSDADHGAVAAGVRALLQDD